MREIKFRAWDKTGKAARMVPWEELAPYPCTCVFMPQLQPHLVDLMQSTGLFDKHGKEIYEGDVVRWYVNDVTRSGVVHWVDDAACFDLKNFHDQYHVCNDWYRGEYEVLGNIYEHPELLEVQQ